MVMVGSVIVGRSVGGVVTTVVVGTVVGSVVGGVVGSGVGGVTNVSWVVIVGVSPAAATGTIIAAHKAQRITITRRVAMDFFTESPCNGTSGSCAINKMRFPDDGELLLCSPIFFNGL
jgi:hypothetical protein